MSHFLSVFLVGFVLIFSSSCSQIGNENKAVELNNTGLALLNAAKYEEAIPYFREAGNLDGVRKTTRALMFRNQAQCY
ncbi:MAG: hypothetical protein RL220_2085, partial [Bacteroidota bacterium]